MNKTKMNIRTITARQAQSIIDIACETWKEKLATIWAKDIVLFRFILIDEEFYKNMRLHCDYDQHKLFDEIFGSGSLYHDTSNVGKLAIRGDKAFIESRDKGEFRHTGLYIDSSLNPELVKDSTNVWVLRFKK